MAEESDLERVVVVFRGDVEAAMFWRRKGQAWRVEESTG